VRSGAVYLYIVSLSGRKVTLPYITPGNKEELHQPFRVSLKFSKMIICPPALQVRKLLMQFNHLKHMKLIRILFKNPVSTLEGTTFDAVNENDH
jgi:hypothetical protein